MRKIKVIYYNFPLKMLEGFTNKKNTNAILNNILDYCIYEKYLEYDYLNENEKKETIEKDLGINFGSFKTSVSNGKKQYNDFSDEKIKVGLYNKIFWKYYNQDKTDFEIICLLGFLAIKSILGNKLYVKTNNAFWLSRMNARSKTMQGFNKLPAGIQKFNTRRKLEKIKNELRENWDLKIYAKSTRGFYVSYKLTYKELVIEVEKKRKSNKEMIKKELEKQALQEALQEIKKGLTSV